MVAGSEIQVPLEMVEEVCMLNTGEKRLRRCVRLVICPGRTVVQSRNKCFLPSSKRAKATYFTLRIATVAQNRMGESQNTVKFHVYYYMQQKLKQIFQELFQGARNGDMGT